jgi:hypothetical protein
MRVKLNAAPVAPHASEITAGEYRETIDFARQCPELSAAQVIYDLIDGDDPANLLDDRRIINEDHVRRPDLEEPHNGGV